ncbi:MAG TPA: DegT/DnrJ/EryC1/StrS family aminotransferase, partial [Wenzhouxiangella sp.]
VDKDTLGMSAEALDLFLNTECERRDGGLYHRATGQRVAACLPVHVLGLPCRSEEIQRLCDAVGLPLIEDAAEALGSGVSTQQGTKLCGSFGDVGVVSFNANKLITTGSGGVLLTNDQALADRARHLSRVAKVPHAYKVKFDGVGYNYGMPALNASLGLAQWQKLGKMQASKRALAERYASALDPLRGLTWMRPVEGAISNDWIMAVALDDAQEAQQLIKQTHQAGVLTRPLWEPMHQSKAHAAWPRSDLSQTEWLAERVVQLPSWPRWV